MEGIDNLRYEERMKRANEIIKRVKNNDIESKMEKSNPDLEIRVDDMIEEQGIEYQSLLKRELSGLSD